MNDEIKRPIESSGKLLTKLCCVVYFVSYITRLDFRAAMSEIIRTGTLTESAAGLIGTILFITYGVGQLISGFLGDKISPQRLILFGLLTTSVSNLLFPFFSQTGFLCVIWGINGFAQAMLWPPMVKLLAASLKGDAYSKGTFLVISASQLATVAIYLIVPVCIRYLGWKSIFIMAAVCAGAVCFLWGVGFYKIKNTLLTENKKDGVGCKSKSRPMFKGFFISSGLCLIVIAIVMLGILRDGITAWMPTFMSEVFYLSTEISILSNVLLPVFSIVCIYFAEKLFRKFFKNEVIEAMFFFGIALISCLVLNMFENAVISIICAACVTGCMHAVNLMLVGYVPVRFKKYGKVSLVSGMTNAFTYIGSAVSSFGFAFIATVYGWKRLTIIWLVVCIIALVFLTCSLYFWGKVIHTEKNTDNDAIK